MKNEILPGMLVRPKRNMNVAVWERFEISVLPSGNMGISMGDRLISKLTDIAIVIGASRPNWRGTRALTLYVPNLSLFGHTWSRCVIKQ
jgi:hypothetical protein